MISKFKPLLVSLSFSIVCFIVLMLGFSFVHYNNFRVIRIDYEGVIMYFFMSAIFIIIMMEFLMQKIALNASYVYLLTIVLKVGFFMLIFNKRVFGIEHLTGLEKSAIIIPMFVFLGIEAFYLMKKMND
jgi:hypothetical protein